MWNFFCYRNIPSVNCLSGGGLRDHPPRFGREIKRRTRVASIFPNAASCLRLVSAILAECDEDWMSGKVYLTMDA